ncbi:MAG: aspartate 1-decarboxylase [Candidatus Omnitrophica bacterium]|nr:aspartate 1-decarboxylase [Candidatus Omnitrophota bacterium]MBU1128739.1 aspartate 1-decarboxylase [Candidatus Omnitrophota bacterium]MBU1657327.1 aspartate 1-decarboxylase [Candidatus Omnitrophota bacterium]MBU1784005.1 aspartate 1-decarboxylase [Candidatus Omnitrophota bacterium]MBU1851782.1 aspartate 1-decarboxylase [Candidatus Omnitrophota bacterium]
MLRILCKSKITNAFITDKIQHHSGSIGVDKAILEDADLLPGEQVQVLNMDNGERFETYVIEEKERSGKIVLYGPAVRKGEIGDELVILSYCLLETKECHNQKQRLVSLAKNNQCKSK